MPKVSVVIPTHDRPDLLKKAIESVLAQTYQDLEVIIVDDGLKVRAKDIVESFHDPRIRYIQHETEKGGSAARNTGIKMAAGEFIAFLDDDDQWVPEKLDVQMSVFANTPPDVGFCFSAVRSIYKDKEVITKVPDGVDDYLHRALTKFNGFLTVTLVIKRAVFDDVGFFDKQLPSHQEPDLIIRISKKYKGLGINRPLVNVNMDPGRGHIGGDIKKRIAGREMLVKKHLSELKKYPHHLAQNYFQLGLWYRDSGDFSSASTNFKKAFIVDRRLIYFLHHLSLMGGGRLYALFKQ